MNAGLIARFEDKYIPEPNTGCFIWTGSLDWSGYGRVGISGRNWKANRVAWLLAYGDPGEMHVLHRCDNRMCVNVDHLFLGTNSDNCADRSRKFRHPNQKLSREQVKLIRHLQQDGLLRLGQIASKVDAPYDSVRAVVKGRCYVHAT